MPASKTCQHCQQPFYGRANKLYCSPSCKAANNNAKTMTLRKDYRFYALFMERNERALTNYLQRENLINGNLIFVPTLKQYGFNIHGPFILDNDGHIVIGDYRIKRDVFGNFILEKRSFTGLSAILKEDYFPGRKSNTLK